MSEAVKTPHINLSYDCDAAIIGDLVDFLKSKYKNITITVNSTSVENDDDELVNITDTVFWKSTTPGDLLAGCRLKHQMTQKTLPKLSGISHATISAYEHNKRPLSKLAGARLANAMGEPADCFFRNLPSE